MNNLTQRLVWRAEAYADKKDSHLIMLLLGLLLLPELLIKRIIYRKERK